MGLLLQTIICSTRPGRIGPGIANWFHQLAQQQGQFDAELVDLASFDLPLYDEPNHPRQQSYQHEHTKAWSSTIARADALVFVLPEYNFCPPPSFFNAVDFLYNEWNYKPCGMVSYGGVSGGLRSAQVAKQLVTTVKMMPMVESVMVQMAGASVDEELHFDAQSHHQSSAESMLTELHKWARALKTMRVEGE